LGSKTAVSSLSLSPFHATTNRTSPPHGRYPNALFSNSLQLGISQIAEGKKKSAQPRLVERKLLMILVFCQVYMYLRLRYHGHFFTFNFTDKYITKKRLPDSIEEVERTAKQAETSASKNKSGVYKNASTPPRIFFFPGIKRRNLP